MTTRWRDDVAESLADSRLAADGWLSAGALARYRKKLSDGSEATLQQWYVYVLEHWYRESSKTAAPSSEGASSPSRALASGG